MRLTLVGHASVFIETTDCSILMDPVLWDPHQEGLFHVYPAREVLHPRLPPFDVLVISHRHLDHFDVRSLAHLPRGVRVFIPQDTLIEESLRQLGYKEIYPLAPLTEFSVGDTRFLTTPSRAPVREFGLVVRDATGSCFNAVDSQLDASITSTLRELVPQLDVMLAAWQPMFEVDFQWNRPIGFPLQRYAEMLQHVADLSPRAVVPGANGFRYCGPSSWLNQVAFPVPRERFCEDVKRAQPHSEIFPMDPGDVLEFTGGKIQFRAESSPFVRRPPSEAVSLDFRPVDFDGRLTDSPCSPEEAAAIAATVERVLDVDLPRFLAQADPERWQAHRQHRCIQQLEVVFPDERRVWSIDFNDSPPRMKRGGNPLATLHSLIPASVLHRIASGTGTWDHAIMGGFYRRFQTIESSAPLADPLRLRFPSPPLQASVIAAEGARWSQARPLSEARSHPSQLQLLGPLRQGT